MRPVDTARSRIVLLGTPFYHAEDLLDVPVIANNVEDLLAAFTDPHLGAFPRESCVVVPADATTAQVGDLLVKAAEEAEDLLLFYYAGHGLVSARRHELYLSLAGTRTRNHLEFSALPFAAVRNACLDSKAENRAVILDSCFSGRAIGETLAGNEEEILGQIHVSGTYTLTSSPANVASVILEGERHTAFTERLLDLLTNGSPTAGSMLTFRDIYLRLHGRFIAENLPVPQQCGTETADRLGLVRNRALATTAPDNPRPAKTKVPRRNNARSTGSSFLDSFFDGLGDGGEKVTASKSGERTRSPSPARSSLGGIGWADFIVDPHGTAHPTRNPRPTNHTDPEEQEEQDSFPRLNLVERGYWSLRSASARLTAASGIVLGLVNLGLALWVMVGPATDRWLWLLIPGVPVAFIAGFSHMTGLRGVGFNLASCFAYFACAVASVMAAAHHLNGSFTPPDLAFLEIVVIGVSTFKAIPHLP